MMNALPRSRRPGAGSHVHASVRAMCIVSQTVAALPYRNCLTVLPAFSWQHCLTSSDLTDSASHLAAPPGALTHGMQTMGAIAIGVVWDHWRLA